MTTPDSTSIAMPPPYTVPEGTLIVNRLIMLTHIHEAEDGSHFLFVPSSSSGFLGPWGAEGCVIQEGHCLLVFNALAVHRGSGIPKASPTSVSHPRLMAFFAIELTQGANLRFPNLHVTQSIRRPKLGATGGRVAKTVPCEGAVKCRGKVVAKCYGERADAAHNDGLCVPCQEGEEPEGGRKWSWGRTPMRSALSNVLSACSRWEQLPGIFCCRDGGGRREVVAPLTIEELGGIAGQPDHCPLAKVCHAEALPWPTLQGHVGIKVRAGTILVVRKGMYGGVARVPLELAGVAQVVELRQVQEYAAIIDFIWLRRMNLVRDDPKKEAGKGMCPCH